MVSTARPSLYRRSSRRRRRRVTRRGWTVVATLIFVAVGAVIVPLLRRPEVSLKGIEDGALFGADDLPAAVTLSFDRPVESVSAVLDGNALPVTLEGLNASFSVPETVEGSHEVVVTVDRGTIAPTVRLTREFTVDTTPPTATIVEPTGPVLPVGPVTIAVTVDDPDAGVEIGGESISANSEGLFVREFAEAPAAPVPIVVTDALRNASSSEVVITLDLPGIEGGEPIRGVHASGYTWTTAELKDPIMTLIAENKINTVEIDLKDEAGQIWWATTNELANQIGAVEELWDLSAVVDELHRLGVRVIGRLVVFRDPILSDWAIETGNLDWIVLNPDGTPYGQYGGYTNPFNEQVWEYNLSIGEEAARLGVDDVLYDYVRRPDAFLDQLRFPLQEEQTPEDAILAFLAESQPRIHAAGARLGASVFGIAATHPDQIAQPIPAMSELVDYVAPMVYPSHWGPNEYGVADPNSSPYDIVFRSLSEFQNQVKGTDATVLGWLQDFSLGVDYGAAEVRAQIDAAADAGVVDFLLWDAAATYTEAALDPLP